MDGEQNSRSHAKPVLLMQGTSTQKACGKGYRSRGGTWMQVAQDTGRWQQASSSTSATTSYPTAGETPLPEGKWQPSDGRPESLPNPSRLRPGRGVKLHMRGRETVNCQLLARSPVACAAQCSQFALASKKTAMTKGGILLLFYSGLLTWGALGPDQALTQAPVPGTRLGPPHRDSDQTGAGPALTAATAVGESETR